jgi:hypothetical protein
MFIQHAYAPHSKPLSFGTRSTLTTRQRQIVANGTQLPDLYVSLMLKAGGEGEPGLSVKTPGLLDKRNETLVIYRDPQRQPICVALLKPEGGELRIEGLAVDKNAGMLSGRATLRVIQKVEELGALRLTKSTTISPDALEFVLQLQSRGLTKIDVSSHIPPHLKS